LLNATVRLRQTTVKTRLQLRRTGGTSGTGAVRVVAVGPMGGSEIHLLEHVQRGLHMDLYSKIWRFAAKIHLQQGL
jgi:hypothetical protein